jgi:hypothetical protein
MANFNLDFEMDIKSSVIEEKIDVKKIYEFFPYRRLSLEIEPCAYQNPDFEFFEFLGNQQKIKGLVEKLISIDDKDTGSGMEAPTTREDTRQATYYLDFFDYVHFTRYFQLNDKDKQEKSYEKANRRDRDHDKLVSEEESKFPK